jgi:hypothetical protein
MWKITFTRLDGNSFFFRYPTQWRKGVLQGSPQNFFNFFQKAVSKPFSERLRSRGFFLFFFGEQVSPTAANNSNLSIS